MPENKTVRRLKYLPPYRAERKTEFTTAQNRSGVYLIKEDSHIVYIGMSKKNLYGTLYRHFQAWSHSRQRVVTYQNQLKYKYYSVRVIFCTPSQAVRLERYLIIKNQPRDNAEKYDNYTAAPFDQNLSEECEEINVLTDIPF